MPKWNSLAFFAVTPGSFHQVAEVLTATKGSRMSISGWFHGKAPPRPGPVPLPVPTFTIPSRVRSRLAPGLVLTDGATAHATTGAAAADSDDDVDDDAEEVSLDLELLSRWINPQWLTIAVSGAQMQEHFAENGSIELAPFLDQTAYDAALKAMRVQSWIAVGPPHLRQYRVAASCNSEGASLLAGSESASSSGAAAADSAGSSEAARVPVAAAPAPPQVASALSLAAVAAAVASDDVASPHAASAKASTAAADAVSEYAHANRLAGGPGTRWREQSAAVPDAATLLWQMLDSREFADFLAVLTGAGRVASWAVEARAIGQGSYTLVTDPDLKRARRRKGAPEDSSAEPAAKRGAASGTVVAPVPTPTGSRESSVAGDSEDEEDDPLRVEACLCMLDPFPGVDADEPWPEEAGGYTVMLTSDEELCTVDPASNSLSVLGVPPGATTFVKFVTGSAPGVRYDVCMRANIE